MRAQEIDGEATVSRTQCSCGGINDSCAHCAGTGWVETTAIVSSHHVTSFDVRPVARQPSTPRNIRAAAPPSTKSLPKCERCGVTVVSLALHRCVSARARASIRDVGAVDAWLREHHDVESQRHAAAIRTNRVPRRELITTGSQDSRADPSQSRQQPRPRHGRLKPTTIIMCMWCGHEMRNSEFEQHRARLHGFTPGVYLPRVVRR